MIMCRYRSTCRLFVLFALCFQLAGCAYTSKELFPENVRTVAVPTFNNRTFYQGVEVDLTEALVKELELRTPYKVTASGAADTEIRGTITSIEQNRISRRRPGGLPQEMELSLQVDFEWRDLKHNEVLRDRRGFVTTGRYLPTDPASEPIEIGLHEAVERMADHIVSVMRADW